ncbi:MAG: hypothetical protein JXR37_04270 [Kiritimatiellae bacterium]|nr:hypothetical protein [Kiritimatiellia bacterium]
MKRHVFCMLVALAAMARWTQAQVTLTVQEEKEDVKQDQNFTGFRAQTYALKIGLRSFSTNPLKNVEVKYWYIGQEMNSKLKAIVFAGSTKIGELEKFGVRNVKSDPYTTQYSKEKRHGRGGFIYITGDSGVKVKGYVVRVYAEDKLLETKGRTRGDEQEIDGLIAAYERKRAEEEKKNTEQGAAENRPGRRPAREREAQPQKPERDPTDPPW